jgi:hypothetical protein
VLNVRKDVSKKTDVLVDGCMNGWVNGMTGCVAKCSWNESGNRRTKESAIKSLHFVVWNVIRSERSQNNSNWRRRRRREKKKEKTV